MKDLVDTSVTVGGVDAARRQEQGAEHLSAAQFSAHLSHLRNTLRQARLDLGLTLADLHGWSGGRFAGYTVGAWERGDRDISVSRLIELAHLYGLPVTQFFGAQEPFDADCEITLAVSRLVDFDPGPLTSYALSRLQSDDDEGEPTITLTGAQIQVLAGFHKISAERMLRRLQGLAWEGGIAGGTSSDSP